MSIQAPTRSIGIKIAGMMVLATSAQATTVATKAMAPANGSVVRGVPRAAKRNRKMTDQSFLDSKVGAKKKTNGKGKNGKSLLAKKRGLPKPKSKEPLLSAKRKHKSSKTSSSAIPPVVTNEVLDETPQLAVTPARTNVVHVSDNSYSPPPPQKTDTYLSRSYVVVRILFFLLLIAFAIWAWTKVNSILNDVSVITGKGKKLVNKGEGLVNKGEGLVNKGEGLLNKGEATMDKANTIAQKADRVMDKAETAVDSVGTVANAAAKPAGILAEVGEFIDGVLSGIPGIQKNANTGVVPGPQKNPATGLLPGRGNVIPAPNANVPAYRRPDPMVVPGPALFPGETLWEDL